MSELHPIEVLLYNDDDAIAKSKHHSAQERVDRALISWHHWHDDYANNFRQIKKLWKAIDSAMWTFNRVDVRALNNHVHSTLVSKERRSYEYIELVNARAELKTAQEQNTVSSDAQEVLNLRTLRDALPNNVMMGAAVDVTKKFKQQCQVNIPNATFHFAFDDNGMTVYVLPDSIELSEKIIDDDTTQLVANILEYKCTDGVKDYTNNALAYIKSIQQKLEE